MSVADLIDAVAAAEDAGRSGTGLVRGYLAARQEARMPPAPVAEGERVTFLYLGRRGGKPSEVMLSAERDGWPSTGLTLARVRESALYFAMLDLDASARFLYRYVVNGRRTADPLNPLHALKERWAPKSELQMPDYRPAPQRAPRAGVPPGSLTLRTVSSQALRQERKLFVYTPHGYAPDAGGEYPFVLFHDGEGYINYAGAPTILDNMIADGEIPPLVAAFVPPVRRTFEYHLNEAYAAFCADDLTAFLADAHPNVTRDPARRAVVGASSGGLAAVYLGFRRPDCFGLVGGLSTYAAYDDYRILHMIEAAAPRPVRFHLVVGRYERHLAGPMLSEGSTHDLLDNQRRLIAVLAGAGYAYEAAEYYDGHNWGFWADHLPEVLAGAVGDGQRSG